PDPQPVSSGITTTIAVVGGPLVAGHGDGRGLGWVGRVTARTLPSLPDLKVYPLAVPAEDSAGLHDRTIAEASLRFTPDGDNRWCWPWARVTSTRDVRWPELDSMWPMSSTKRWLGRSRRSCWAHRPSTMGIAIVASPSSIRASPMSRRDGESPTSMRSLPCSAILSG